MRDLFERAAAVAGVSPPPRTPVVVTCPCCFEEVPERMINAHLDMACRGVIAAVPPEAVAAPEPLALADHYLPVPWALSFSATPPALVLNDESAALDPTVEAALGPARAPTPALSLDLARDTTPAPPLDLARDTTPALPLDLARDTTPDQPLDPALDRAPAVPLDGATEAERYYERYLLEMMASVCARHAAVLLPAELETMALLRRLPGDARRLCVRLFNRKRTWFRVRQLSYTDIRDVRAAAAALEAHHLLLNGTSGCARDRSR